MVSNRGVAAREDLDRTNPIALQEFPVSECQSRRQASWSSGRRWCTRNSSYIALLALVNLLEPAGGRGQQHHPRLVLKRVAELPGVVVAISGRPPGRGSSRRSAAAACPARVREAHQLAQGQLTQRFLVPPFGPILLVFRLPAGILGLLAQVEDRLEPELTGRGDLVALFGEYDRVPTVAELRVRGRSRPPRAARASFCPSRGARSPARAGSPRPCSPGSSAKRFQGRRGGRRTGRPVPPGVRNAGLYFITRLGMVKHRVWIRGCSRTRSVAFHQSRSNRETKR